MAVKFPADVWGRVRRLITSLISVKCIPAWVCTVKFIQTGDQLTMGGMILTWALVVGFRYAEKVKGLIS